ncbi:MAG: DUF697 domain-containing protein [Myxococcales bacterium]|nr:DUF697 domain-containing protein [Myxococcales bacterium]MDH3485550.1 DUF697 domain-containing protein [Myxococcales bacterium]
MARPAKKVALDQLVKVLDRVPIVSSVKNDLTELRALLYNRRPPRLAALGLPSSGRSSLLRALIERSAGEQAFHAEHGQWVHIEHVGAKVEWIELDVGDPKARSQWEAALDEGKPDLVLITVEPKSMEDAAAIIERCKSLLRSIPGTESSVRVFPLLTHADLIGRGPQDVESVRRELAANLRAASLRADPARAVSAISGHGLEGLSEAIVLALPEEARLEAARSLTRARQARIRIGNEIVQACTAVSVTVGVTPIPFSDMVVLGPLQAMMVSSLAYLSGRTWGRKTVAEWLASLGVVGGIGMGLRFSAQTIAKFVPGAGNAVSAGVAGAGTTAMGQSAIKYFLRD